MLQGALISVILAIGFLGVAASRWEQEVGASYSDVRDRAAAEQLEQVRAGTEDYIAAHRAEIIEKVDSAAYGLTGEPGQAGVYEVSLADVQAAGFLSPSITDHNAYGQPLRIVVREHPDPAITRYEGIVFADNTTGATIPEARRAQLAKLTGDMGGVVVPLTDSAGNELTDPATGETLMQVTGTDQVWQLDSAGPSSGATFDAPRGALAGYLDLQRQDTSGDDYHWEYGPWGACNGGTGTWDAGYDACPAGCSDSLSQARNSLTCDVDANSGNQSRAATGCYDGAGQKVADSLCDVGQADLVRACTPAGSGPCASNPEPPATIACADYAQCQWQTSWGPCAGTGGNWNAAYGVCDAACGDSSRPRTSLSCDAIADSGTETASFGCLDGSGNTVNVAFCSASGSGAGAQPTGTRSCTGTPTCAAAEPAASEACTDYTACRWAARGFGSCSGASASWITGGWSACSSSCGAGTQNRSVSCSLTPGTQSQTVDCVDSAHGNAVVTLANCTALGSGAGAQPATSQACGYADCSHLSAPAGSTSCYETTACNYDWVYNGWGAWPAGCNQSTRTRSLQGCWRSDGYWVANSECQSRKGSPYLSETTTDYRACQWNVGGWGACDRYCYDGTTYPRHTRAVTCRNQSSQTVPDSWCGNKPATSEYCNTRNCTSEYVQSTAQSRFFAWCHGCNMAWGPSKNTYNAKKPNPAGSSARTDGAVSKSEKDAIWGWNACRTSESCSTGSDGKTYDSMFKGARVYFTDSERAVCSSNCSAQYAGWEPGMVRKGYTPGWGNQLVWWMTRSDSISFPDGSYTTCSSGAHYRHVPVQDPLWGVPFRDGIPVDCYTVNKAGYGPFFPTPYFETYRTPWVTNGCYHAGGDSVQVYYAWYCNERPY